MAQRMTLTHDPAGARVEFRHLDESHWYRTETPTEGVTVFRSSDGAVAAVIVDLSLADGGLSEQAASAIGGLLGPAAVEAARSLSEGEIDVESTASLNTRLVTTIELGTTSRDVRDLTVSAADQNELIVSAEMGDDSERWAVVIDTERLRPVAAGRFSRSGGRAIARLKFGLDPTPGRYRVDVTSAPFDVPPAAGGTAGGAPGRGRRLWTWLAVVGAAAVIGVGALLAVGWSDRELPPSGPATTSSVAIATTPPVDLQREAHFQRYGAPNQRIELTMSSPSVVGQGDVVEFEFRHIDLDVPSTAFDPAAETLQQAIASCRQRIGMVHPLDDRAGSWELIWFFRVVPVEPAGPPIEHDIRIVSEPSGTELTSCGEEWADEEARQLVASRNMYYVPETVRLSVNRLMHPGRYEVHVVSPDGQPWPVAEPLEFLVVDGKDLAP